MIIYNDVHYYIADEGYIFKNQVEPYDECKEFLAYTNDLFNDFLNYEEVPILKEGSRND